jgi:hypothetical protein
MRASIVLGLVLCAAAQAAPPAGDRVAALDVHRPLPSDLLEPRDGPAGT